MSRAVGTLQIDLSKKGVRTRERERERIAERDIGIVHESKKDKYTIHQINVDITSPDGLIDCTLHVDWRFCMKLLPKQQSTAASQDIVEVCSCLLDLCNYLCGSLANGFCRSRVQFYRIYRLVFDFYVLKRR